MADKSWKAFERLVARFFGARGRTPLSGGNSGHTRSDTLHPRLFIECKRRMKIAVVKWYLEEKVKAEKEGKIPMLALKAPGQRSFLVLCDARDLRKITEEIA